jgi:hypothetical protein
MPPNPALLKSTLTAIARRGGCPVRRALAGPGGGRNLSKPVRSTAPPRHPIILHRGTAATCRAKEASMDIPITDILFHVRADLSAGERGNIERDLQGCDGVLSAHFSPAHPHLLEVAYNPDTVSSGILREHLSERGLRVSMAGL